MLRVVDSPVMRIVRFLGLSACAVLMIAGLLAQPREGMEESHIQLTIRGVENRSRIESLEGKIKRLEDIDLAGQFASIKEKLAWIERMILYGGMCICGLVAERAKSVFWPRRRREEEED